MADVRLSKREIRQIMQDMVRATTGMTDALEHFISDVQAILNTGDLQGLTMQQWQGYQTQLNQQIDDLNRRYTAGYGILKLMVDSLIDSDSVAATYLPSR